MSSRIFAARTGAGLCGLCERAFAPGSPAFFLTCRPGTVRPTVEAQVESDRRTFRTVRAGTKVVGRGREVPVYAWEERRGGSWVRVQVWERMVHVACARANGYRTPVEETVAKYGTRVEGHAHTVETPVQALASAVRAVEAVAAPAPVLAPVAVDPVVSAINAAEQNRRNLSVDLASRAQAIAERNRVARGEASAPLPPRETGVRLIELDDSVPVAPVVETPKVRPLELD